MLAQTEVCIEPQSSVKVEVLPHLLLPTVSKHSHNLKPPTLELIPLNSVFFLHPTNNFFKKTGTAFYLKTGTVPSLDILITEPH